MSKTIMVVDDEKSIRDTLKEVLTYAEHEVVLCSSGKEALKLLPEARPDLILLDVKMADMDGIQTLRRIRELDHDVVVVMMSGHGSIATAVQATQAGAWDFMEKPLDNVRLELTLRNALEKASSDRDAAHFHRETEARHTMVGRSDEMEALRQTVARVGPTPARVLITGENGSGKELVARAIHDNSSRARQPFVEVNCAAIPSELFESELFGHMKGSFTGATADRPGKFEQADGGTLFLDEIGDMELSAQAKVLRALQEGEVTRIGGAKAFRVDVRVIAATNKDLPHEIAQGRFREDLYYRLNVVPIRVPPLRERREDIPLLIHHFEKQLAGGAGAATKRFDDEAVERLAARHWPGNVRELRNAVERLLILSPGKNVGVRDIGRLLAGGAEEALLNTVGGAGMSLEEFLADAEKTFLAARLAEFHGDRTSAAKSMGISRSLLTKRMQKFGLGGEGA
ncbi:MAG: sigma-54-dependent Fis family transcriptional regulator [Gemmatimonadetes bacterium]|nr:sigma-54-dependent Fis family transcriptional regulator [Gemmatimonadota bacterium]